MESTDDRQTMEKNLDSLKCGVLRGQSSMKLEKLAVVRAEKGWNEGDLHAIVAHADFPPGVGISYRKIDQKLKSGVRMGKSYRSAIVSVCCYNKIYKPG